jgi:hypothetical protein
MTEKGGQSKIRALWKWLVSGAAVVGASIWGALEWLGGAATTGVIAKTAVTTGVVAVAAAFTFSFGDKATGVDGYAAEAYQMIVKGQKKEAVDYTDKLIAALDQHIEGLEKEIKEGPKPVATQPNAKEPVKSTLSPEEKLKYSRNSRQAADLLQINIKMLAGQMTDDQWMAAYEKALNADAEHAKATIAILTKCASDKEFPPAKVGMLLKRNIPAEARGELALWLMKSQAPDDKVPSAKCAEFYEGLLAYSADSSAGASILNTYVTALDKRKDAVAINDVLANYISLFYGSEIGVAAAKLAIARQADDAAKNAMVIKYVDQYPNSALSKGLLREYASALVQRGDYAKALAVVDTKGVLKKVKTPQEAAGLLVGLAGNLATPTCPAETICIGLSQSLYESGDYANSMELDFAVLQLAKAVPVNLMTQRPIRKVSEVIDSSEPKDIAAAAKYFLAYAMYLQTTDSPARRKMFEELRTEKVHASLEPYVLYLLIQNGIKMQQWDIARQDAAKALATLPASQVLLGVQNEIELKYQQAKAKEKIVVQQKALLEEIAKTTNDGDAIRKYEKLADLYLASNDLEQAVGAYLLIAEKYPKNAAAPSGIASAIALLEQTDKERFAARIAALIDKLKTQYPDSPEGKRYTSEVASAKK